MNDPLAELLAGVWCNLLGIRQASPDQDFFKSGGDSLSALQLVSRAKAATGIPVPLREFFDASTFGSFVDLARRYQPAWQRETALRAALTQEALWREGQFNPTDTGNTVLSFTLSGPVDAVALAESIQAVMSRHEVLRYAVENRGGVLALIPRPAPERCLTEIARDAETLSELTNRLRVQPMAGVGMGAYLHDGRALVVVYHRLHVDDESIRILHRDLGATYAAQLRSEPAELPELPGRYADFAVWQHARLAEGYFDRDIAFAESLPGRALSTPAGPGEPGPVHRVPLALGTQLRRLADRHRVTPLVVLLAHLRTVLAEAAGVSRMTFGVTAANRTMPKYEGVVGPFAHTVPIAVMTGTSDLFDEDVRVLRDAAFKAMLHQEFPGTQPPEITVAIRPAGAHDFQLGPVTATLGGELAPVTAPLQVFLVEDADGLRGSVSYLPQLMAFPSLPEELPALLRRRLP